MEFLVMAGKTLGLTVVFLIIYYVLNTYLLKKIKISKWLVLGLFILTPLVPGLFQANDQSS